MYRQVIAAQVAKMGPLSHARTARPREVGMSVEADTTSASPEVPSIGGPKCKTRRIRAESQMKRIILAAATVAIAIGAACSDNSPSAPVETGSPLPFGVVVSNVTAGADGLAYVSAEPATFANATSISISNLTRGGAGQTIALENGGFDPRGIAAATGEELSMVVHTDAGGLPFIVKVPATRQPRVVRTDPSISNNEIATDASMLVVFSEPVDKASVTTTSIVLVRGGNQTEGRFEVAADGLSAQFIPRALLQAGAEYALVINAGVHDLDAEALGRTITVTFSTVGTSVVPVAGVGMIATTAVTTVSDGSELDPDGYAVSIDGHAAQHVDATGTVVTGNIEAGAHSVSLSGLSGNCGLADGPVQRATVTTGATTAITFNIVCAPLPPIAGRLAFVSERDGNSEIYALNADGTNLTRLTRNAANDNQPAWSPDGKKIAFVSDRDAGTGTYDSDIYIMDADGSNVVRLTFGSYNTGPSWSPDSRKLAFSGVRKGDFGIYIMSLDNPAALTSIGHPRGYQVDPTWSPDGSKIAFTSDWNAFDFVYDVFVTKTDGSGISMLFQGSPFADDDQEHYFQSAWSPNGRRIAVVLCNSTWGECYPNSTVSVGNADGSGLRALVQTTGRARPAWSPDASVIAFGSPSCPTCVDSLQYMWVASGQRGVITSNGHSPSWRP